MQAIKTVGDLRKALEGYPDDKLVIFDDGGDTYLLEFYNWSDKAAKDNLDWPVAFRIKWEEV